MEATRLKELAGLVSEKKKDDGKGGKFKPKKGMFKQDADKLAKDLGEASQHKALARLNFFIEKAKDKLTDEDKERLERTKKKLKAKNEEYFAAVDAYARRAGLIIERKNPESEDPDMDLSDQDEVDDKGEDKAEDKKADKKDDEEDTLPKIVKKIAKKAVGKDVDQLEDLISKVYDAGHKDGEKASAEGKPKKEEKKDDKKVEEAALSEKHHVKHKGKVTKKGTKAECDAHAEKNGGDVCKGDGEDMNEEALSEKHHVKKGGKITKRGSKKDCDDHAEKNGGDVMKGEGGIEESEDLEDVDFGSINEDWTEVKAAMAHVRTDRLRAPCMTPKGSGTIEIETATLPKGQTDPKAGPFEHTVTVKLNGSANKASFPAQQVKFFKGQKPSGGMLPKGVGSVALANADKGVTAKGTQANQPGKQPKGTGSFLDKA